MTIRPIFLLSISRTGSTVVQRIIAAHEGIATAAEPWLLLPHAYTLRPAGVDAEYVHPLLVEAVEDFAATLPGGREEYVAEMRSFALDLYARAGGADSRYFLDKTPPYSLIGEELMEIFPEGKFVFLWRNPLSVLASMVRTWGPWHPSFMSSDLFIGLPRLIDAYDGHRTHVHAARYEDLIGEDRDRHWKSLMDYLEVDFDPDALTRFAEVELPGRMGDPTGRHEYSTLSTEPDRKWTETLSNPLRRLWARRYLRFLGAGRLATMGYDLDRLTAELDALPPARESLIPDAARALGDLAKEPIRVRTRNRRLRTPNAIRELLRGR